MEEGALIQPIIITKDIIDIIIQKIIGAVNPEKIILFGSYAKGNYNSKSDLDIAVIVKDSKEPQYRRAVPIRLALSHIIFPKDIVVFTEQEIIDWQDVPQAFITTILKTGKIIYLKDEK